ncbi:MAG: enoyl-CoA hydratase/isomerase family protein [Marmoricola sp.]
MTTHVRLEVTDGVAVVTLDGPEKLNAFSATTAAELGEAYRSCAADDAVRVLVLTGAGRAFCSGADLGEAAGAFDEPGRGFSASPVRPPAWEVPKLVIAAVNGHAIGIGLTTALQCDVRYVAQDARLAIPQVRFGMLGDGQSHFTLRRIAGTAVAADLLLTGRTVSGAEAVGLGLASRALPADEVLPAALELAREVAAQANPASVAASKSILWDAPGAEETERRETDAHRRLMAHQNAREGAAAWREGRLPRWT